MQKFVTEGSLIPTILFSILAVVPQIAVVSVLPKTAGFSDLRWTFLCMACNFLSIYALSMLIKQGLGLGIVVPFISAAVPLVSIFVAYFVYGEPISGLKGLVLVGACVLIGVAGALR